MSQFTQREFLFLDDLLHMEELQTVFACDLAAHASDPQVKNLCLDIARQSEQHFNTLLQQLDQQSGTMYHSGRPAASAPQGAYTYGQ